MLRLLNRNKLLVVLLGMVSVLGASYSMADLESDIRARLQPAGQVCVMGTECAASMAVAGGVAGEAKDPAQVYQTSCFACHGSGANNAPIYGNAEAWAPRIEKGMDVLMDSLKNGFNNGVMPAKGLCMTCSDEDLQAVLDYMLEAVQ